MISAEPAQRLADQRRAARRARAQGRHWYLRAALMVAAAGVALFRGGQLNTTIGVVLLVLSLMSWHLGRQMRRQATEMDKKITLMEEGTGRPGDAGTGGTGA